MTGVDASLTSALDPPQAQCCLYHYEKHVREYGFSTNGDKTKYEKLSLIKCVSFHNTLRLGQSYS